MDEVVTQIGSRLNKIRKDRQLSLEDLASATGFTKSYLSKIENAKKVPPIGSLSLITGALGIELSHLFQPAQEEQKPETRASVVRATERQSVVRGGTTFGYDYESLGAGFKGKRMDPFVFTFPCHIGEDVHFEHEGQEFVFVVSGRLEFKVDQDKWDLGPGDSIYFDAALPHRGRAIGGEAKALVVICSTDPVPS